MGGSDSLEDACGSAQRATSLSNLEEGAIIDEKRGRQTGYVLSWRARSLDLTGSDLSRAYPESCGNAERGDYSKPRTPDDLLLARLRRILQPPVDLMILQDGPLGWPHALFPYQQAGVSALMRNDHVLLGDEMGLGKTVQAIAALRMLFHRHLIERVLVVAPAGLIEQWMTALHLWSPELRCSAIFGPAHERDGMWFAAAHVVVATYETVRSDAAAGRTYWDLVILDEAQKIKNPDAEVSRACKSLRRSRSWAMTGTPLENRIGDLTSILDFVLQRPSKIDSIERAMSLLMLTQLRRRKHEVLPDLPPKIITELPIELTHKQRDSYDLAEREGIVRLSTQSEITIPHVLSLITRLKQICNFDPATGDSSKMNDLVERLEEITENGNKVLIFSQFTDSAAGVERIADRISHLQPLVYTGRLYERERAAVLRRFDEDDSRPILILSLKAGGVGLNLQRASYVFHFDRWWNPAVEAQAEDRAHRIGQPDSVSIYRYVVRHSIEERIDHLIREKQELFRSVVDAGENFMPTGLTKEDLLRLVGG